MFKSNYQLMSNFFGGGGTFHRPLARNNGVKIDFLRGNATSLLHVPVRSVSTKLSKQKSRIFSAKFRVFFAEFLWHFVKCIIKLIYMHAQKHSTTTSFQGGREHWAVYYTSPQSFIIPFPYSLAQQLCGLVVCSLSFVSKRFNY